MKTQVNIYGTIYEIEFKAKDMRNLNASPKATLQAALWLEGLMLDARYQHNGEMLEQVVESSVNLHNSIRENFYPTYEH